MTDKQLLNDDDLCNIVGVTNGVETLLGRGPKPWRMKAKEIFRSYGYEDWSEHDLDPCYAMSAAGDLVAWMIKVGWKPPPMITEPAAKIGEDV